MELHRARVLMKGFLRSPFRIKSDFSLKAHGCGGQDVAIGVLAVQHCNTAYLI